MPAEQPNWEGLPDTSEHRTVGPHRAWCFADAEWCYPEDFCWCCDQTLVPAAWKGEHVGALLVYLRKQVQERHDRHVAEFATWNHVNNLRALMHSDYRDCLRDVLEILDGGGDAAL